MIRIERKNKVFTHPYAELNSILPQRHFSKGFSQKKDCGVESRELERELEKELDEDLDNLGVEPVLDRMDREVVYNGGRIDKFDMFGTRGTKY